MTPPADASTATPTFRHTDAGRSTDDWSPWRAQLPRLDEAMWAEFNRQVVLAAHPDDETLMAGGLMRLAHQAGLRIEVVILTDGAASHPGSPSITPPELAVRRLKESENAARTLAPDAVVVGLARPDGMVEEHSTELLKATVAQLGDARATLLICPDPGDGHPDHEAAATLARVAAARTGATVWSSPIWLWHWADPATLPVGDSRFLSLSPEVSARKEEALRAHVTQTTALSSAPEDAAVLSDAFLDHFRGGEVFCPRDAWDDTLERLHADQADPWQVESSEYEVRKRAITLALLGRQRYRHGVELGCSIGALAAELARRCDRVTAVDASTSALNAAAQWVPTTVSLTCHDIGDFELPDDCDLIVFSEVGYFLSPLQLEIVADRLATAAASGVDVVSCHYRGPIDGYVVDGDYTHRLLSQACARHGAPAPARYAEDDYEILAFCRRPQVE